MQNVASNSQEEMSYDLYFYKKKNSSLTEESFADYLTKNLNFNNSENSRQWSYENPETAVYFWIDWSESNTEDEDIQLFDKFDDFTNLNFTFGINFFRPQFFGLEIFPIIEKIIKDNDLWVLNPQDEEDPDHPRKFNPGYLKNQWIQHNNKVTIGQFNELDIEYYPLDKSNYMWWFLLNRDDLQNKLTEDIFVAGYFMIKSKDDGKLYTGCVWPEHIPIVLPPVDYVIIKKTIKTLFKTKEESGLVSYQTIMDTFGEYFESFENEIPDLKVLRQKNADLISKDFNKLTVRPVKDFGVGVSFDKFVNVRP